jgi:hypothetical protein
LPSRCATALADVAGAGALQVLHVEAVLAAAREDDRRRVLALVDVPRRLAVEADAAVRDPGARALREALPPRSKAGRTGREARRADRRRRRTQPRGGGGASGCGPR